MQVPQSVAVDTATSNYRKLMARLASQAVRMGSNDPQGVVQEALRRAFENSLSRHAVEYYLRDDPQNDVGEKPSWPFLELLRWLHGVVRRVVLEEHSRARSTREVVAAVEDVPEVRDPSPDQLDRLIERQLQAIVRETLSSLDEKYRRVLTLRATGLKYSEIAASLGESENTIATWVSRGMKAVTRQVHERMYDLPRRDESAPLSRATTVSHV